MKILVVSQYFWPENFRINDLCTELAVRGHKITVLTGVPNYPEGEVFEEYRNDPDMFTEYEGSEIIRVPMIARGKGNSIKLAMNYLSYALSASFIGAFKLRNKKFDMIFVFEPSPITVGLPAIFIKKIKKIPVVFWVLDLWPETLEALGVVKSKHVLNLVGKLVSFIYNRCDLVLGQSKAFFEGISHYTEDKVKIKYFPSWSENVNSETSLSTVKVIEKYNDAFKVLFTGNVGEAQDFPAILKAASLLKDKQENVKFFIVGDGRMFDWVKAEISNCVLNDYVYLLGRYPLETMPSFYSSANALLVTLKDSPVFAMTIPGKIQSYLASGKPILTMLTGEGSRVVEEAECGYIADSGDYETLAENIIRMAVLSNAELSVLGGKAKFYAESEFDRDKLISQLEVWFVELVDKVMVKQA